MLAKCLLTVLFTLYGFAVVCAQEHCVFQNHDILVTIQWRIDRAKTYSILLQVKPLNDIYIPDEEVCFGYAGFNHQVQFNNVCGIMINGKWIYTIDGLTCCKFRFLSKDSTLSYTWQAAKAEVPNDFRFDFNYIGSREYTVNKKHNARKKISKKYDLAVPSRDMDKFQSTVHLQIPSPICRIR